MAGELFLLLASCIGHPQDSNPPDTTDTSDTAPIDTQETGDADTDTDSDIDTDSDADADTDTDTDSDADCDSYSGVRFSDTPDYTFTGERDDTDIFGTYVAAGDVDGDGAAELVVSAPGYEEVWYRQGAIYIYEGGSLESKLVGGGSWGLSADAVLDIDDDEIPEMLCSVGEIEDQGGTLILKGGVDFDGYDFTVDDYAGDPNISTILGTGALTYLGDINGDGVQEAASGGGVDCNIISLDPSLLTAGSVVDTSALVMSTVTDRTSGLREYFDHIAAGDITGDGVNEVCFIDINDSDSGDILCAKGGSNLEEDFSITDGGLDDQPYIRLQGEYVGDGAGVPLHIQDLNGDGYGDLVIGDMYFDNGHSNAGRVVVLSGQKLAALNWDTFSGAIELSTAGIAPYEGVEINGLETDQQLPHYLAGYTDDTCRFTGFSASTSFGDVYHLNSATLYSSGTSFDITAAEYDDGDPSDDYGAIVAFGDVTGDGIVDKIVTAPAYGGNRGAVYVMSGAYYAK